MPSPKPIVILQMGRPPDDFRQHLGEQQDWFSSAIGDSSTPVEVVRPFLDEPLPLPGSFSAAIISGSWAMVTDREPWSERTATWIRDVMTAGDPLLGVCYGHQLMAHALGGEVDYHPRGREIGTKQITLSEHAASDPLFASFPEQFDAHLTHEQFVLKPPAGATVLGRSDRDAHQILRYGPNAVSVQFHPEFTPVIMRACIARRADRLRTEGAVVDALLDEVTDTPQAHRVLLDFLDR